MERGFPDALDLLVICVESGLSIDAAIARVAGELGRAHPVLGEELRHAAVELRFLPDRADALANLEARTGIDGVRALVALLHQTERFGTPLADALRTLAAEMRTAAFLRVEERAARLPAVLTVPMILFILPPLFIVLIGPVIAQLLAR
jgi:tight adherence protein C